MKNYTNYIRNKPTRPNKEKIISAIIWALIFITILKLKL